MDCVYHLRGDRCPCVMGTFTCGEAVDFVRFFTVTRVKLFHFLNVWCFVERTAQTCLQQRKVRSGVAFAPPSRVTCPLLHTQTHNRIHRETQTDSDAQQDTQRETDRLRHTTGYTERHKQTQTHNRIHRETQTDSDTQQDTQRDTDTHSNNRQTQPVHSEAQLTAHLYKQVVFRNRLKTYLFYGSFPN